MRRAVLLAALCALGLAAGAGAGGDKGFAIVGATVIDGTGAPPLRDAVVVVQAGRIQSVGPRAHVSIPKGVVLVEGRGRFVVPGLIDAHVHFFQSGGVFTRPDIIDLTKHRSYPQELAGIRERLPRTFARYLLCGITSVVDVGGPMWNFEVREQAAATAIAPRVAVAGPLLSTVARLQLDAGDPPIIKVAGAEEARALLRRQLARKPDLIKVWFIVRTPEDLAAGRTLVATAVAEASPQGVPVAVHATELEAARAAVEAGAKVLVHSVWDRAVDETFVRLLKDRQVVYTPTLFVPTGYAMALTGRWTPTAAEARWGDPEVMASFEQLKKLPEFKPGDGSRSARAEERDRVGRANLARLVAAGVPVAAGTDAGNIGTLHGPSLFRELRAMQEAGLTTAQVLTAATLGGARVMGRERELGSVEAGKRADLLLLEADPLADLGALEKAHSVVKDGRIYAPEELRRAAEGGDRR